MNHPHLAVGQKVIFVGADKKTHDGTIRHVYGPDAAQIEFEGGGIANAEFSDKADPVTFHFEQASPKEEQKKPEAHNQHKKE